jgi:protoheme IX farnesyltransferase
MVACAVAIWLMGYAGAVYGVTAALLSVVFFLLAAHVGFRTTVPDDGMKPERRLFWFSIFYLFILFAALVADRWIGIA